MKIVLAERPPADEPLLVLPVLASGFAPPPWLDAAAAALCRRDIALARFAGGEGEALDVSLPDGTAPARIVLVGAGADADLVRLGGRIVAQLKRLNARGAAVALDRLSPAAVEAVATGMRLKAAPPLSLKRRRDDAAPAIERLTVVHGDAGVALDRAEAVADAVLFARRLVDAPPNHMTPAALIAEAEALSGLGLEVETIVGDDALGATFPGLVAVGRGSAEESGVAIVAWRGAGGGGAPAVALSAKGVTFDSGGLTAKTEAGQRLMKIDMAGAAAALGTMAAIARLRLPIDVVAAIGAVENLPGPHAYRSGDVVTMGDGTTVEISFPDAEGRIVMADLNAYLARRHDPAALVNLSTLTYAAVAALGDGCMALFANDDALAHELLTAGGETGEAFWRLPVGERYAALLSSDIADFKNMVAPGMWGALAGSGSAAAEFLRHFAGERRWASLDILGGVWRARAHDLGPAGATGEPVRTLVRWLETIAGDS